MADRVCDTGAVYEAAQERGDGQRVAVLIHPGRGDQPSSSRSPVQRERNRNIRPMRKLGRGGWYDKSGYTRRSLVENTVFRHKTVFGPALRSWPLGGQRIEVSLACKILNTMARLGMPDSVRVRWRSLGGGGNPLQVPSHAPRPAERGRKRRTPRSLRARWGKNFHKWAWVDSDLRLHAFQAPINRARSRQFAVLSKGRTHDLPYLPPNQAGICRGLPSQ